mmetsp:Transcript_7580/g.11684  ORF Transcript_7580/g.11684 Transcript_7580/m.11684 type:complete len:82 (+) Transcript_7580:304-549(+)
MVPADSLLEAVVMNGSPPFEDFARHEPTRLFGLVDRSESRPQQRHNSTHARMFSHNAICDKEMSESPITINPAEGCDKSQL